MVFEVERRQVSYHGWQVFLVVHNSLYGFRVQPHVSTVPEERRDAGDKDGTTMLPCPH